MSSEEDTVIYSEDDTMEYIQAKDIPMVIPELLATSTRGKDRARRGTKRTKATVTATGKGRGRKPRRSKGNLQPDVERITALRSQGKEKVKVISIV